MLHWYNIEEHRDLVRRNAEAGRPTTRAWVPPYARRMGKKPIQMPVLFAVFGVTLEDAGPKLRSTGTHHRAANPLKINCVECNAWLLDKLVAHRDYLEKHPPKPPRLKKVKEPLVVLEPPLEPPAVNPGLRWVMAVRDVNARRRRR